MFMFSCCSVFSRCCFCFSLSVLNLFPGLENSPSSLTAGVCEVLLGNEGPWPLAAGVTGRRPEGTEPAGRPAGWTERLALRPRFLPSGDGAQEPRAMLCIS